MYWYKWFINVYIHETEKWNGGWPPPTPAFFSFKTVTQRIKLRNGTHYIYQLTGLKWKKFSLRGMLSSYLCYQACVLFKAKKKNLHIIQCSREFRKNVSITIYVKWSSFQQQFTCSLTNFLDILNLNAHWEK